MFDDELLNRIFEERYEDIEENIQREYHYKIKQIKVNSEEERNNIKMNIISELYYTNPYFARVLGNYFLIFHLFF